MTGSWEDILKALVLQIFPLLIGWLGHRLGTVTANGHKIPTSTDEARAQAQKK